MSEQQQVTQYPWVRLHFMPQTESGHEFMPSEVTGILIAETAGSYALMNVLEDGPEGMRTRDGIDYFNKTYVWRCSTLPDFKLEALTEDEEWHDEEGGLG